MPTIMIVDDTPMNLMLLEGHLHAFDYDLQLFERPDLALQSVEDKIPDLVLLDIMMPEMDGFTFCREFKAIPGCEAVPVIFISALSDMDSKVRAFGDGGVDYIIKPFKRGEVLARVQTHLMLRAQRQEIEAQKQEAVASGVNL